MAIDQPNWLDQVQLAGGTHAIEVMAIGVEWSAALPAEQLGRLTEYVRNCADIRARLPEERSLPGFQVFVNDGATSLDTRNFVVVDFVDSPEGANPAWSLSLRPELISCSCTAYTRWDEIRPRVLALIEPVLREGLAQGLAVQAIGIQYADAFRWSRTSPDLGAFVLRQQSRLLPAATYGHPSLWHSHHGWFSAGSKDRRVLNLVNVDLADEQEGRVLKVNGQHRLQATDFAFGTPSPIAGSELGTALEELHRCNKMAIQEVLSDPLLDKMHFQKV